MNTERLPFYVICFAVLCITGLVAQCTHSLTECKLEGMKAGKPAEEISKICRT